MSAAAIRRLPLVLLCAVALLAARPPLAHAEFGPIELVSKSSKEQADRGADPAISGDGHYVVFAGRLGRREGVFRKDLRTGEVAFVAPGQAEERMLEPSISGDGRYVVFTTNVPLVPGDEPEPPLKQVYVADLASSPPTYRLVSAADGSTEPLPGTSRAAGRVALSDDGREAAFTNEGQVYVRDLDTDTTTLITGRRDPLTGATTRESVPGGGVYEELGGGAAAISADGSTVVWIGRHLPEQVPMLGEESTKIRELESRQAGNVNERTYSEPLWRRVPTAADPSPPIRRVVGGGDPLAPGCPAGGTLAVVACQGPYPKVVLGRELGEVNSQQGYGWGYELPVLSADGNTVAVVGDPDEVYDLFVVDMKAGLTRDEAATQLTHWINPQPDNTNPTGWFNNPAFVPYLGAIAGVAISPDGKRIAFTTRRQYFAPNPPNLITPPPPGPSPVAELYQVDLENETIERGTPSGGQPVSLNGMTGAGTPSYSADGSLLAFSSDSSNLVPGDTNENEDAFVVSITPAAPIGSTVVSERPPALATEPLWRLTVSSVSLPNGTVRVLLGVPGAGSAQANAAAPLGPRLRSRRVAAGKARAAVAGPLALILKLPPRLRRLAHAKRGLYARVKVNFSGPGGSPLHAELETRFRVHEKRKKK